MVTHAPGSIHSTDSPRAGVTQSVVPQKRIA
jgi:hypothetical protein